MEKYQTQESVPVLLKEASISDIPVLIELEKSVAGTNIYSPTLDENEWTEELQKSKVYLIEKNSAAIGNISYERKGDDHVYISGLAVNPVFQGQGVAREALMKVLEELKGVKRIDLVTHPDNRVALQIYQSLGFVVESRKENFYGDGEPRMVLVLVRT